MWTECPAFLPFLCLRQSVEVLFPCNRTAEVRGSIPLGSTNQIDQLAGAKRLNDQSVRDLATTWLTPPY